MYKYIQKNGITDQRRLYGQIGEKIIDVYEQYQELPSDEVIALMTNKIKEVETIVFI